MEIDIGHIVDDWLLYRSKLIGAGVFIPDLLDLTRQGSTVIVTEKRITNRSFFDYDDLLHSPQDRSNVIRHVLSRISGLIFSLPADSMYELPIGIDAKPSNISETDDGQVVLLDTYPPTFRKNNILTYYPNINKLPMHVLNYIFGNSIGAIHLAYQKMLASCQSIEDREVLYSSLQETLRVARFSEEEISACSEILGFCFTERQYQQKRVDSLFTTL